MYQQRQDNNVKQELRVRGSDVFALLVVTHFVVGVSVAVRIGQDQQVNVHGVQKGGQGRVSTVISGHLNKETKH